MEKIKNIFRDGNQRFKVPTPTGVVFFAELPLGVRFLALKSGKVIS